MVWKDFVVFPSIGRQRQGFEPTGEKPTLES